MNPGCSKSCKNYEYTHGVFGTSKHTDSYIWTNNRRVKKELQILFAILAAGTIASRREGGVEQGRVLCCPCCWPNFGELLATLEKSSPHFYV